MSELESTSGRDVTLRFNARNVLLLGTVAAGALWADLILGLGLYGIYSQWAARRLFHLAGSVTVTFGLSLPLFLLYFTVAAVWVVLSFVGVRSHQNDSNWSTQRLLAVGANLVAAIILFLAAGWDPVFTGHLLSPTLLLSLLLALDGALAAMGVFRFFQRSRG